LLGDPAKRISGRGGGGVELRDGGGGGNSLEETSFSRWERSPSPVTGRSSRGRGFSEERTSPLWGGREGSRAFKPLIEELSRRGRRGGTGLYLRIVFYLYGVKNTRKKSSTSTLSHKRELFSEEGGKSLNRWKSLSDEKKDLAPEKK